MQLNRANSARLFACYHNTGATDGTFLLVESGAVADLTWRLIMDWGPGTRSSTQNGTNSDAKPVLAVAERAVDPATGATRVGALRVIRSSSRPLVGPTVNWGIGTRTHPATQSTNSVATSSQACSWTRRPTVGRGGTALDRARPMASVSATDRSSTSPKSVPPPGRVPATWKWRCGIA